MSSVTYPSLPHYSRFFLLLFVSHKFIHTIQPSHPWMFASIMEKTNNLLLFIISFLFLLCFSSCVSSIEFKVKSIYVFGDSIFDAGNNHYNKYSAAQADFPPYGSTFFHRPTGRFTDGRTVADFLCEYCLIILYSPSLFPLSFSALIRFFTSHL